ncbi:hypothetical protein SAMN02745190_00598 [Schwartzia succinivorans DSM 10502]|jgi:hypothetical protein|uniref:Uncharacterized protein n=1 Tax=Schwartzia succinivorans DSM 10502 TaxID=1123243 RepID=A0A1M4UBG1_9FIRM|nr:hypothetical protein SAMN02745190_00598 [Schwartzia succinivorans DSM 10502]
MRHAFLCVKVFNFLLAMCCNNVYNDHINTLMEERINAAALRESKYMPQHDSVYGR